MAYLLYYQGQLMGCYGIVELLRANILIILFQILEKKEINSTEYSNLYQFLTVPDFAEDNFKITELRNKLRNLGIRVEKVVHENNVSTAFEMILKHIKYRFQELSDKMEKDVRIRVKIPGSSVREHDLGTMYYDQWKLFDPVNCDKITKSLHQYIAEKIMQLMNEYKDRVCFGDVHYQEASDIYYQVWSANAANWNLPTGSEIPGCYQAQEMKFQEAGVFGIVVTPMYGYKDLVPKDI